MRALAAIAASLLLAPLASAQEGPAAKPEAPARHVNKVTDEAKAAFEKWHKVLYRAADSGLKTLEGTVRMKPEMPGMEGMEGAGMPDMSLPFSLTFRAPGTLEVAAKGSSPMMPADAARGMAQGVRSVFRFAFGAIEPEGEDAEYDAEVVAEAGKKAILVTSYEKGAKTGVARFVLDERGAPVTGAITASEPGPGGKAVERKVTMEFVYGKEGERLRLDRLKMSASEAPAPMEFVLEYADAGGIRVPAKISMGMQGMNMTFRFAELAVNGKKVDPAALKEGEGGKAGAPAPKGDKDGEKDGDDGEEDDGEEGGDDGMK